MKKCIILAAVIGIAACQWSWTTATTTSIYQDANINLNIVQQGDLAYLTTYSAGIDPSNANWHLEAYGARMYMNATFTVNLALYTNWYVGKAVFTLTLFDITPYQQVIRFYRPDIFGMQYVSGVASPTPFNF